MITLTVVSGNKILTDMKKTFKFFAAALAVVAAASCMKENTPNTDSSDSRDDQQYEMVDVTFSASLEAPVDPTAAPAASLVATRTTLASDGISVHWSENDKISVFPYVAGTTDDYKSPWKGSQVRVINESINAGYADFEGNAYASNSYAAIYPFGCINSGNTYHNCWTLNSNTIKNQTAVVGGFPQVGFGVAHIAIALECENASSFKFKNQLSYLKFRLNTTTPITEIIISSDKVSRADGRGQDIYLSQSSGLGGPMYYNPHKGRWYMYGSGDISFKNNGNPFENGKVYYIAIPAVEIEGLHFTAKSSSGSTIVEFKRASILKEATNQIYDLGVLNQTGEAVNLNISNKNISAPNVGGNTSFTIQSNFDWTIEENYDWLSLDRNSGSKSDYPTTITISVTPNISYSERRAYITVKSGSVSQEILVKQNPINTYKLGDQVTRASNMVNGEFYIIRNNSDHSKYWHVNYSGSLEYYMNDTGYFDVQYVLCYRRDDSKGKSSDTKYESVSTGAWRSAYNNLYMSDDFVFNKNENAAVYIANSNWWGGYADTNVDMCQIGSTNSICWNGKYFWGSTSESNRKWLIYKVVPVN